MSVFFLYILSSLCSFILSLSPLTMHRLLTFCVVQFLVHFSSVLFVCDFFSLAIRDRVFPSFLNIIPSIHCTCSWVLTQKIAFNLLVMLQQDGFQPTRRFPCHTVSVSNGNCMISYNNNYYTEASVFEHATSAWETTYAQFTWPSNSQQNYLKGLINFIMANNLNTKQWLHVHFN